MEENMTFSDLGLSPEILQALEQKGYGYPTTVQAEAIPQCVLQSSQCSIAELTALTTELKQLRDRLSEQR